MKRLTLIICFLWATTIYAQINQTIDIPTNEIRFTDVNIYKKIIYGDYFYSDNIGTPEIPIVIKSYAIPIDASNISLQINNCETDTLCENIVVFPVQPPLKASNNFASNDEYTFIEPDSLIYSQTNMYPNVVAKIIADELCMGFRIIKIAYYPFVFIPQKQILCRRKIECSLSYNSVNQDYFYAPKISERRKKTAYKFATSLVENKQDIMQYAQTSSPAQIRSLPSQSVLNDVIPDYLIITNEKLKTQYQRLAQWKTKKGVPTIIKTIEEIERESVGADLVDKIRNYISDFGNRWGSEGLFLLLGGDTDVIPTRKVASVHDSFLYDTDAYYVEPQATISWYNHNYKNDSIRNIFMGRIPISDVLDLSKFIDQLFHYEKCDLNIDYSYFNNLLMATAFMEKDNKDGYMDKFDSYRKSYFPTYGKYWYLFDHFNCNCPSSIHTYYEYDRTYGSELNKDNFLSAINSGTSQGFPHIICHKDHGYMPYFGTSYESKHEGIYKKDLIESNDTSHFNIILSGSCNTTNFSTDCIGENFLYANTIAYIGNTDIGWRNEHFLIRTFLQNLYTNNSLYNIGAIHLNLLRELTKSHRLHLLGDPEMPIWTNVPQNLNVSITPNDFIIANFQSPTEFKIKVNNLPEGETAVACIMKDDELYRVIEISNTEEHSFWCTPLTAGTIHVTVTAHNFRPYEYTIPVEAHEPVLSIDSVAFLSGNNGIITPGENVSLRISLKNSGLYPINDITAYLDTYSPYISIVNKELYCDKIDAEETVWLNGYFRFNVSSDAPEILRNDFNAVTFHLGMTKETGDFDVDTFRVNLIPPINKIVSHRKIGSSTLAAGNVYRILTSTVDLGQIPALNVKSSMVSETSGIDTLVYLSNGEWQIKIATDYEVGDSVKIKYNLYSGDYLTDNNIINLLEEPIEINKTAINVDENENSIMLYWNKIGKGCHVYRSTTSSGTYTRLNKLPLTDGYYIDENLSANTNYYYKVSVVNNSLLEGPLSECITTRTCSKTMYGFPTRPYDDKYVYMFTPKAMDFDYNGQKEIIAMGWSENTNKSKVLVVQSNGREPYNYSYNSFKNNNVNGFVDLTNSLATPVVADIYGNAEPCIITLPFSSSNQICCYSSKDKNRDGSPDSLWAVDLNLAAWENAVITDIDYPDGKGEKEIIIASNPGSNRITILDCNGQVKQQMQTINSYNVSNPAVADLDNDEYKEIIYGCMGNLYIWKHDGTPYGSTEIFYTAPDGMLINSTPVICDIDKDGSKDIIIATSETDLSYVLVIKQDGTCINGFNGDSSSASISFTASTNHALSVGDIDADGYVEIVILGHNNIKAWNHDGTLNLSYYFSGLLPTNARYPDSMLPILADVDGDESIDIVFCVKEKIYAINNLGDEITGFPLKAKTEMFKTEVSISDVDGDGLNEIIAGDAMGYLYLWKTTGKSTAIEWGRAQFDTENTSEYISGYQEQWIVTTDITWNGDFFNNDIIVRSGALTIPESATLTMRKPYRIYVLNGATLNIYGGKVIDADIVVKSGATLNVSKNAIIQLRESGGKLQIENGAIFNLDNGNID